MLSSFWWWADAAGWQESTEPTPSGKKPRGGCEANPGVPGG